VVLADEYQLEVVVLDCIEVVAYSTTEKDKGKIIKNNNLKF
jgi:hypothetical protein